MQVSSKKEKLVRIRGEFIPMTPYEWRNRVNLSVKVGLGTGSKEQQLILLNGILQRQTTSNTITTKKCIWPS